MTRMWAVLLYLAIAQPSTAAVISPGPVGEPNGEWREQIHWVPMTDAFGQTHLLYTRVCRPRQDTPARVVLINHGSPPNANARPTMAPLQCESEVARWFLSRGYLVVAGMRRGYGMTGGAWAEGSGPNCSAEGYAASGRESARDIDALGDLRDGVARGAQRWRGRGRTIGGGWAADAYDSVPHPKVIALVSMAGGRGGHMHNVPNLICRPEELDPRGRHVWRDRHHADALDLRRERLFFAPDVALGHVRRAFAGAGGKADLFQLGAIRPGRAWIVLWPGRFGDLGPADGTLSGRARRVALIAWPVILSAPVSAATLAPNQPGGRTCALA